MSDILRGALAGAAGTAALNAATYLDIAVRGRPPSTTPEESVQRLAEAAHLDLGEGEAAENRKAGLGPLMGYATGIAASLCYTLLAKRRPPLPVAAGALAALAMAGSNSAMTALGVTDPRRWSAADWAADVVPHLAYGVVAAIVLDRLR